MDRILAFYDRVNDLRINVILNYFLLVCFFVFRWDGEKGISPEDKIAFAAIAAMFVGFSYLLNRYTDYHYDIVVDRIETKFRRPTYLWIASGFLIAGILLIMRNPEYAPLLIIGAVFGIPYSVPTILSQPFKNYLFLKTVYSSGSKSAVILYWLQCFAEVPFAESVAVSMIFFFSHSVFGILWDVRDVEADRVGGVRTIPNTYGVGAALSAATAANIAAFLIDMSLFSVSSRDLVFFGSSGALIILTEFIRHPRFFHAMIYWNLFVRISFVNDRELDVMTGAARSFLAGLLSA